MDAVISPGTLSGTVGAIASKSMAHRMLICAALCPSATDIELDSTSRDIEATAACLVSLGASISRTDRGYHVEPLRGSSASDNRRVGRTAAFLDCGESGSTERFMLPLVCALGSGARIVGHGRLSQRPLSPLFEELIAGGCSISDQGTFPLVVSGQLRAGRFILPGNVSSQFTSGLLMAAPLLGAPVEVSVSEPVESRPYIELTKSALATFGVTVLESHEILDGVGHTSYIVSGATPYRSPDSCTVEGDWSNAAFWLCAGALAERGTRTCVSGLDLASVQGDRAVLAALAMFGARVIRQGSTASVQADDLHGCVIDASDIPDLVPPLSAVAALSKGTTRLKGCGRLRLKESDRLEAIATTLSALGSIVETDGDDLVITGVDSLTGGRVASANDHRIAMMAAIAATRATEPVTISGSEAVRKSYPTFFDDFARLNGNVEAEGV